VLGEDAQVADRFHGADMLGAAYEPPFPIIPASEYGDNGHTVLPGDFVTAEDGTGIVHTAIAFGEDDFRLGAEQGLNVINPVRLDGTYDERIGPYAGRWVKDADPDLVEDLRARDRLLRAESYLHAYPHCWRCGTPLIYYAKPSWFIRTSQLRDRLLAANETIDWRPEHIKHGRMGKWLENNVDWALSRERYWGTPLPVWRNDAGETVCIGSLTELEELSGVKLDDPHRPYVDDVEIPSPTGGEPLRRVPEVIDVWFDSGSMPFAQHHAPYENQESFEANFPADYICEAIDQTRGWFYSLLAISTLLFDRASYRTCLVLGHIADPEGKKMSKSLGNIVVPWEVIDQHGADAFRWYYLASKQPWDGYLFSTETVGESVRQFLLQLWNTYGFYVLYANVNEVTEPGEPETELDRWAISRLHATTEIVRERLDDYDATRAGQAIAAFVDDLSNWYVRRSRPRFWDGDRAAFGTLHRCLVTVAHLLAPFCPFIADEIYDNLDGAEPSVHLCDFPEAGPRDVELEIAMGVVRETVRLGLAARGQAKLGVRQPLHEAVVVAAGAERAAIERLEDIVLG
jgi:isoleucyl-tRNA synthetase